MSTTAGLHEGEHGGGDDLAGALRAAAAAAGPHGRRVAVRGGG